MKQRKCIFICFLAFLTLCGCSKQSANTSGIFQQNPSQETHSEPSINDEPVGTEPVSTRPMSDPFDTSDMPRLLSAMLDRVSGEIDEGKTTIVGGEHLVPGDTSELRQYDKHDHLIVSTRYESYEDCPEGRAVSTAVYERFDNGHIKRYYDYTYTPSLAFDDYALRLVSEYDYTTNELVRDYFFSTETGNLKYIVEYDPTDQHSTSHPPKRFLYTDGVFTSYSTYTYDEDENVIGIFNYTPQGILETRCIQTVDSNGQYIEQYVYDKNNQVVKHCVAAYDDNGVEYSYVYNSDNQLVFELYEIYVNGVADHMCVVEYDENGEVSKTTTYGGQASRPSWAITQDTLLIHW